MAGANNPFGMHECGVRALVRTLHPSLRTETIIEKGMIIMATYFARHPISGEYEDITYRSYHPDKIGYTVWVGDYMIGFAFKPIHSWNGWKATSSVPETDLLGWRSADNFKTRWHATEYLLRACGIWKEND